MKILNLAYPEKSDIRFHDGLGNIGKTALFPDGQQQVVINPKCLTGGNWNTIRNIIAEELTDCEVTVVHFKN